MWSKALDRARLGWRVCTAEPSRRTASYAWAGFEVWPGWLHVLPERRLRKEPLKNSEDEGELLING